MTRPQVPALMVLALDYYREPLAFRHLSEVQRPLPDGFDALLADFCAALSLARLEDTAEQLGVEPAEVEAAARFLVRHVLLNSAGDYYRHLGLNRDASAEAIRHHYQLLIRQFHPDRVDTSTEAGAFYATRINLAYQTLRQVDERERYDAGLPPYPDGVTETDAAWFFRPNRQVHASAPAVAHASGRRSRRSRPRVGVWVVVGLGVVAIIVSLGFVLSRSSQPPTLRLASTARGQGSAPLPHYLTGSSSVEQGTAPGGASKVPAEAAVQVPERVPIEAESEPPPEPPPDPPLVVAVAEPLSDVPKKGEQAKREQAERERAARNQAERERIQRELAERQRAEREKAERELAERQKAEREQAERDKAERERLAREQAERERVERELAERQRAERAKADAEEAERQRIAREQAERERIDRELAARQKALRETAERERAERQQAERQRAAPDQTERERFARELAEAERQRVERERAELQRAERLKAEREQAEREKAEREKAERQQAERERVERELAARQKAAREKAEREKAERQKAEREQAEREQAERQRAAREQAERQRVERERAQQREQAQREKVESAATALMSRLESAYRMENAAAFAALFTADAQVNEGSGRALIRRRYADLFARSEASELSINAVRWQLMPSGRLKGTGRISVRNRYVGSRNWQRVNGRVDLELVSFGSGYRIARMIDYLN